jgi:hypothetical protein
MYSETFPLSNETIRSIFWDEPMSLIWVTRIATEAVCSGDHQQKRIRQLSNPS